MKKRFIILGNLLLVASTGFAQIELNTANNVGIGIAPTTTDRLLVSGGTLKIGNSSSSSERAKNMIKIGDGDYVRIGEWEADDILSFYTRLGYSFTNGPVGLGTAPNSESKLRMQTASKHSIYLANTGSSGTAYGIYTTNTASGSSPSVYGLYAENLIGNVSGGNLYGIRMYNVRQGGASGTLYGMYLSNICNTTIGEMYGVCSEAISSTSIPVYGIYSFVGGASAANTYSGYFTGGKVWIDAELYAWNTSSSVVRITSDERLKSDIKPLDKEMNKLYQLQGKAYKKTVVVADLQDSLSVALRAKHTREPIEDVAEFGYLAQELQEIFPELVSKDDATGYYAVNYIGLIPVIVEALKEQRLANEQKQAQIDRLQEMMQSLSAKVEKIEQK